MEQIKYNLKMSISIHWCASEKIYSAQKTPKTIKMCQNQNKIKLISYYYAILNASMNTNILLLVIKYLKKN